jgi:hypothetical protein
LNSFEFSSQKPSNRSYISHQHLWWAPPPVI